MVKKILAERLIAKGYTSYYDAEVSVMHKESSSIKQMTKNRKKLRIKESNKSMDLYLKEYRKFSAPARWICKGVRKLIIYIK